MFPESQGTIYPLQFQVSVAKFFIQFKSAVLSIGRAKNAVVRLISQATNSLINV